MERAVYEALNATEDGAGAFLWRRLARDLCGPIRVGLVARDRSAARRWCSAHALDDVEWVPLVLADDGGVDLGAQDRLLSTHALLFLTSVTAPLGQAERQALADLEAAGAPAERQVGLMDLALLERLSDDPAGEAEAVAERVRRLLPPHWPLLGAEPAEWLKSLVTRSPELRDGRRAQVAHYLLGQRREELLARTSEVATHLEQLAEELGQADEALAEARRRARRLAAHTLAIVRRQTERLELDLAAFLRDLEAELPAQIHALEDVELARRTLPHWLTHVVETWMTARLDRWRADVLRELEELELPDAVGVDLLVPALQPAPVKGDGSWTDRLGTTAAFGGAAALLMLGLWIPGLVALAGGFALSSVFRGPSDAENQGRLVATARLAVRQMGEDANRLLADQLERLSTEIERLGADEDPHDQGRAARRELDGRRVVNEELRDRLAVQLHALDQALADLTGGPA